MVKRYLLKQWLKSQANRMELIVVQPTPYCNLQCKYCYLATKDDKARMSMETLAAIVRRIEEAAEIISPQGATLCWHAGEPLSIPVAQYEQYYSLIDPLQERLAAQGKSLGTNFQTNGTLIDERWIEFFRSKKGL